MNRKGLVYRDELLAGTLEEREDGWCVFAYLPEYLTLTEALPISLTLPLSPEPVETWDCIPSSTGWCRKAGSWIWPPATGSSIRATG